jgi:hypothetical protein
MVEPIACHDMVETRDREFAPLAHSIPDRFALSYPPWAFG